MVIGHSSLVIRHWSFVIGHSSLVIRHWSFVIGHSSLVIPSVEAGFTTILFFSTQMGLNPPLNLPLIDRFDFRLII
ncbi:hypothetical protein [Coleofasciculus sp. E2-BRE-01]|uniref:hypothetical protein n=1 Tax=Coleofasciculus sp. E2-BRE-01 TaxID=3069524 RepID=UPI004062E13B